MIKNDDHLVLTPRPLYSQVRETVRALIRGGEWLVGDALPNEFALAKRFGVSVGTVRRAIAGLEADGLLQRVQGRGTFVAGFGSHVLKHKFTRLLDPNGESVLPTYVLNSVEQRLAKAEVSHALRLPDEARVIQINQGVVVDGSTIGIETSYVSANRFGPLERQVRYGVHLYPILADLGTIVVRTSDMISVADPGCRLEGLNNEQDRALLRVVRTAFAIGNLPVEFREAFYDTSKVLYASDTEGHEQI